jgi:SAM-dependent methyltransferase
VSEAHERVRLARTFDTAAELYDRARPTYPDELFDHLLEVTGLSPGAKVLESGCGTGKASVSLARRGLSLTCLEPGPALAAIALRNLRGLGARVEESSFEDWPPPKEPFDLVAAATSWHWLDPDRRTEIAARALRKGGWLAVWSSSHAQPPDSDPFFDEIQEVYEEIGEGHPKDTSTPGPAPADDEGLRAEMDSPLFELVDVKPFLWETTYECEEYIDLLRTFSGHILMEDWQRDRLFSEIRHRLSQRPDRSVRRPWGATLHIARRR